jgi:hypothetical protein
VWIGLVRPLVHKAHPNPSLDPACSCAVWRFHVAHPSPLCRPRIVRLLTQISQLLCQRLSGNSIRRSTAREHRRVIGKLAALLHRRYPPLPPRMAGVSLTGQLRAQISTPQLHRVVCRRVPLDVLGCSPALGLAWAMCDADSDSDVASRWRCCTSKAVQFLPQS